MAPVQGGPAKTNTKMKDQFPPLAQSVEHAGLIEDGARREWLYGQFGIVQIGPGVDVWHALQWLQAQLIPAHSAAACKAVRCCNELQRPAAALRDRRARRALEAPCMSALCAQRAPRIARSTICIIIHSMLIFVFRCVMISNLLEAEGVENG